jgi:hypothetical protein
MPGSPKRTQLKREADYLDIIEMDLRGKTQRQIAAVLKLTQVQIHYDMKVIRERWRKETNIAIDDAKAKELAKLDLLESEYWEDWKRYLAAWEASKIKRSKTRKETDGTKDRDGNFVAKKVTEETEARDGNPAFLKGMLDCKEGIRKCMEDRRKILGLDAPAKSEVEVTQPIAITIDR